jgi:hypothetical protein
MLQVISLHQGNTLQAAGLLPQHSLAHRTMCKRSSSAMGVVKIDSRNGTRQPQSSSWAGLHPSWTAVTINTPRSWPGALAAVTSDAAVPFRWSGAYGGGCVMRQLITSAHDAVDTQAVPGQVPMGVGV